MTSSSHEIVGLGNLLIDEPYRGNDGDLPRFTRPPLLPCPSAVNNIPPKRDKRCWSVRAYPSGGARHGQGRRDGWRKRRDG